MQVVFFLALLIQDSLLLVKSFLQTSLVLLQSVVTIDTLVLLLRLSDLLSLLGQHVVLDECLLKQISQSQTLISVVLNLIRSLFVLAHLDILLQFLDFAVLHL